MIKLVDHKNFVALYHLKLVDSSDHDFETDVLIEGFSDLISQPLVGDRVDQLCALILLLFGS